MMTEPTTINSQIHLIWKDMVDIIGDKDKWPRKIRHYFWGCDEYGQKRLLNHWKRLMVAAFVYVNGLNPYIFLQWAQLVEITTINGMRHLEYILKTYIYLPTPVFMRSMFHRTEMNGLTAV